MRELNIRITADRSEAHDALAATEQDIRGVEEASAGLGRETRSFGERFREAYETPGGLTSLKKNLQALGGETRALGTSLTVGVSAPLAAIGYWAQDAGMGLIQTLNQIEAVTGATSAQMTRMRDAAQEWGQKTVFSSADAADALLQLSKAGLDADQAIGALPATLQLAVAAELSMGEAARATANTLAVFKLGVEDMAGANDILVAAANASTMDVSHLTTALKFVGPVAAATKTPLEDVAAMAAVLADNGIRADMAGTGMRGMMTKLLAPTKATSAALTALGFGQQVAAGETVAWADMLDALKVRLDEGGATADEFTGHIMRGFGQRAGPAVLALAVEGGAAIKAMSAEFAGAQGTAERMTDAMMKGLPGAVEELRGSMETMGASLLIALEQPLTSIVSALGALAEFVTGRVLPMFNALPAPVKTVGVAILGLAAVIGPLLVALGGFISMVGLITPALPVLGAALAVLTGPIGLVIGAVVALGAAWMAWGDDVMAVASSVYSAVKSWLWDKLEPVLTPLIPLLQSIGEMFSAFADLVVAVGRRIYDLFIARLMAEWEELKVFFVGAVDIIKSVIGSIPDVLLPLLGPIGAVVLAFRHWDTITAIARTVYEGVKTWMLDRFTAVVDSIRGKVDAVTGFFRDMYDAVVGNSFVPDMVLGIQAEFAKLQSVMVAPATTAINSVTTSFRSMTEQVSTLFSGWGESLGGHIQSVVGGPIGGAFANIASGVLNSLGTVLTGGMNQLINMGMQLAMQGLKAIGEKVWSGLKSIGAAIGGAFQGEGAKTNDTRDDWMKALGGLEGAHGVIAQYGNDAELMAAFEQAYFAGNRNSFQAGADAFGQRLAALQMGIPELAEGGVVPATQGGRVVRVAEAGKAEAIIPLDEAGLGAPTFHVTVNAQGAFFRNARDVRALTEEIVREMPGVLKGYRLVPA